MPEHDLPAISSASDQFLDLGLEGIGQIWASECISHIGGEKSDFGAAIERLALIFQGVEGLAFEQRNHGVGDLDLAAGAFFLGRQEIEDVGLEDIAAKYGEVGGFGPRLRLLHHAVDGKDASVAFADLDHAIVLRLVLGHGLDRDDVAATCSIDVEHLSETAFALGLHQDVGKKQSEGFVADELARAPDRMAEAERLLLTGEARAAWAWQTLVETLELGRLAARGKNLLELELPVEMVLDHAFIAPGDEDEVLDPGFFRFIHHVLDERTIDNGQHFFRHRLGGGKKARA